MAGRPASVGWITLTAAGVITGVRSLSLARELNSVSLTGRSIPGAIMLLTAGWSLMAAGMLLARTGGRRSGFLFILGGFAWFAAEWNSPSVNSAVVFTAGLLFSTACPALIGHALMTDGVGTQDRLGRIAIAFAYFGAMTLGGLLSAIFLDPAQQGCADCPANLIALWSVPADVDALGAAAVVVGPFWCALLILVICRRMVAATPERRRLDAPTLLPGVVYLVVTAAIYGHAYSTGAVVVDGVARVMWAVQACLLALTALGTCWPRLQRRLTRARVADLVVDLAAAPPVGGLSAALSRSLHDPSAQVLYVVGDRLVDGHGVAAEPDAAQAVTRILRGGEAVAVLAHRPGLLDDPRFVDAIAETVGLALDNERLWAQTQTQLAELMASRSRIVQATDAERRRLERDLHDGAQQRLVALALSVQLAALRRKGDAAAVERLTQARAEVTAAIAELRGLARGIYPRELADEGLAAALGTLAETSRTRIEIGGAPAARYPHPTEAAAFLVVAGCTGGAGRARVSVSDDGRDLTVRVVTESAPADVVSLRDRVGALGGTLRVDRGQETTSIMAVLPCGW